LVAGERHVKTVLIYVRRRTTCFHSNVIVLLEHCSLICIKIFKDMYNRNLV